MNVELIPIDSKNIDQKQSSASIETEREIILRGFIFFIFRVNKYCHRRIVSHTTSFKHILFSNPANRYFSLCLFPISVCINLSIIFLVRLKKNYHSFQSCTNHNIISQSADRTIGFKYFFMVWAGHHKRKYKFRWGRKALAWSFNLSVLRCACMLAIKWFSCVYLVFS